MDCNCGCSVLGKLKNLQKFYVAWKQKLPKLIASAWRCFNYLGHSIKVLGFTAETFLGRGNYFPIPRFLFDFLLSAQQRREVGRAAAECFPQKVSFNLQGFPFPVLLCPDFPFLGFFVLISLSWTSLCWFPSVKFIMTTTISMYLMFQHSNLCI